MTDYRRFTGAVAPIGVTSDTGRPRRLGVGKQWDPMFENILTVTIPRKDNEVVGKVTSVSIEDSFVHVIGIFDMDALFDAHSPACGSIANGHKFPIVGDFAFCDIDSITDPDTGQEVWELSGWKLSALRIGERPAFPQAWIQLSDTERTGYRQPDGHVFNPLPLSGCKCVTPVEGRDNTRDTGSRLVPSGSPGQLTCCWTWGRELPSLPP